MNIRPFQHILINNDTGETKTLTVSPMDWADITINHYRHELYESVLFQEALNQRFPYVGTESEDKGGGYFLRNAYESNGVKADVTYKRQILSQSTNAYIDDFEGKIDYSADSGWSNEDEFFDVKIIDSRKLAKFLSRDNIDVNVFDNISIDGVATQDFFPAYQEGTFKKVDIPLTVESDGGLFSAVGTTSIEGDKYFFTQNIIINEPGDRVDIETGSEVIYTNETASAAIIDLTLLSLRSVQNVTYTPTQPPNNSIQYFTYYIFSSHDENDTLIDLHIEPIISDIVKNISEITIKNYDEIINIADLASLNVPVNGYVKASFFVGEFAASYITADYSITNSIINFNFIETTLGEPDNQIRGLYAHEMATRFVQLYTSETDTSKLVYAPVLGRTDSQFITYIGTGYFGRDFTTNGFQIRQFTGRALNANFRDWFTSLKADNPIGFDYNKVQDYFEIGNIYDFYKAELANVHLGAVKNLKIMPASKKYYNKQLCGETKIDVEQFQGANEVNTETEYSISIETKSSLNTRSIYNRATIPIEITRRKTKKNYASEDTKLDKKVFIVKMTASGETEQGAVPTMTGFRGIEQYYNQGKTPRQCAIRQQLFSIAPLFKDSSENVKFIKSEKDVNISYLDQYTLDTVNEQDDIPQLRTPLFYPEIYEGEVPYTTELRKELETNPHAIYPFYDKGGNELYGYILTFEGKLYKKEGKFTMIRVNDNRVP